MSNWLIRRFIKNWQNTDDPTVRERYGTFAGGFGIVCNLFLCVIKIMVGLLSASLSITADGLNNLSDMGSSVITMICFRLAGKPADPEHPFGHGRMEYLSAFMVAMLILLLGFELLTGSAKTLIDGSPAPTYSTLAIVILVLSVAVKLYMFFFNRHLGQKIDSEALMATAQDSINDVITTGVILLCVVISRLVTIPFNLDAVLGIGVALFILYSGVMTARDTINKLLGEPPAAETIQNLKDIILSFDEFRGVHDLIVHNYGPGRVFATVHVEVPQTIDIVYCHEQVDLCEKVINERTGIELTIHMDPVDTDNVEVEKLRNHLSCELKKLDNQISIHDFRMTPKSENRTNLIFDAVMPSTLAMSKDAFIAYIEKTARAIDPTYVCVVTVDSNYSG